MGSIADDTRWLDATDQAALVRQGELSPLELLDAAIERIEAGDAAINAVVLRWFDAAREAAASPDLPDGPFRGVPFLLKDLWAHFAGQPLTNGNRALAASRPVSGTDTTLVGRYRSAGLVIAGRTNSPELGSVPVTEPLAYGPTRNPWDLDRTPGGSSGGAAAAVAAGFVPVAHASDGGGSLLDATAGPGVGDSVLAPAPARPYADEVGADPGRLRIGFLDHDPRGLPLEPECAAGVRATVTLLESLGHTLEAGFPAVLGDTSMAGRFMAQWATNMATGIAAFGEMLGRDLGPDDVEPVNWAQAEFARHQSAVDLATAQAAIAAFRRQVQQWWADGFDLLVTPTVAELPPRIGEHDAMPDDPMAGMKRAGRWVAFTGAFNMSGQPAISLPLHWTAEGLPVGVQLVAAYGREDLLIRVASQLEAAAPWAHRRPPIG